MSRSLVVLLVLVPSATPAAGVSGRYLLAYADCRAACREALVQSRDGVRWSPVAGVGDRAGESATAVRRGTELYLYEAPTGTPTGFGGGVRRFRLSAGTVEELPPAMASVQLTDLTEPQEASPGSFAASFLVDESGALTVVYALRLEPSTNACPVAGAACVKLRTATEVAGSDGTEFAGDPGNRLVVSFPPEDRIGVPSVFKGSKGYLLFVAGPGGCVRAAAANDLHGKYSALGGCLAGGVDSPSGFWNERLDEYWLYAESGGQAVRAVTRELTAGRVRFRPLAALTGVRNPRFAPNSP